MNPVSIVTIKELIPLYKNGEEANAIQLATFEEHGYKLVVGKGLYEIGSKGVYMMPDYCVPIQQGQLATHAETLFKSFTEPGGDPKKSRLGKNGRIRAIKFNFSLAGEVDPVFSNGILLPLVEIANHFATMPEDIINTSEERLQELLQITKYEEPETAHSGLAKGDLPSGMYSTDETNVEGIVNNLQWPLQLVGSLKIDGSSETIYYIDDEHQGICSRRLEKKLDQVVVKGYTTSDGQQVRRHFDRESSQKGWFVNEVFYLEPEESWTEVTEEVDDSFVKIGKPILEKLRAYCKETGQQLALRGELCGQGLKGSGNKNNPHAVLKQQILFYGVDDYSSGATRKVGQARFGEVINALGVNVCEQLFIKVFNSYEELYKECMEYFKTNLVEGIVCRTLDSRISFKFINPDYDSRK